MSKSLGAATLAVKLAQHSRRLWDQGGTLSSLPPATAPAIASDAVKLMRLAASLRGLTSKRRACFLCRGRGTISLSADKCSACEGSGFDKSHEDRLSAQVTATLAPYGLTWTQGTDGGPAVLILFPDGQYTL